MEGESRRGPMGRSMKVSLSMGRKKVVEYSPVKKALDMTVNLRIINKKA